MSRSWTPKPQLCGGVMIRKIVCQSAIFVLCAVVLASCGPVSSVFERNETAPGQVGSQTPSASTVPTESSGTILQPLEAPPGLNERPLEPGLTGMPKTSKGLPVLQPPLGIKSNPLFLEQISNDGRRLDRLENAVQELRDDFDLMSPSITRLVAVEEDIQALITQLEILLNNEPVPASVPSVSMAEAQPVPLQPNRVDISEEQPPERAQSALSKPVSTPLPSSGANVVQKIRIGEHPGKTRIVLDVSANAPFSADIDNTEKLLLIELPKSGWSTASTKSFGSKAPLLQSYRTESLNDGQGTLLILQLKRPASILSKSTLSALSRSGKRLVIDLGAQ